MWIVIAGTAASRPRRRFWLGARCIEVLQTIDNWLAPDHRYFKVAGDDGGRYILRHDPHADRWELTFFDQT